MKICTIIGGIDGVGKSSLLGVLGAVRTDLGLVVDEKEKAASERIETALKDEINFSYETTLHEEFSKELCRRAKDAGYTVRLYYVALDPVEENLLRIKNRAKNSGANTNPQEVQVQYVHRFDNITAILSCCDCADFYDNYNGFALVARKIDRCIEPIGDYHPQWIQRLYRADRASQQEMRAKVNCS